MRYIFMYLRRRIGEIFRVVTSGCRCGRTFRGAACWLLVVGLLVGLVSCSTKKNTAMSRQWQAFTTRYNVYYNGDEHYKETLKSMENGYEDDCPDFITSMQSASRMVESLCATTKLVRPCIILSKAFCIFISVRVSIELVASSSISIGGKASITRAIDSSCLCP